MTTNTSVTAFFFFFKYYFMNQFIWIITAPVLFDSKYCDIACYWGNYPIQLLVTEWFVSTFPSYIAIVYGVSLVPYIQQYNISVDFF